MGSMPPRPNPVRTHDHRLNELERFQRRDAWLLRAAFVAWALAALVLLLWPRKAAAAEGAYLEASATRISSYVRTFPGVRLVEQRGFWGAEVVGRLPVKRFALIGRGYSEGAAGSHSWRDPSTWHRAVAELAVSYPFLRFALDDTPDRYTLGVMAGGGLSWMLERGSYEDLAPDEDLELDGPPPKYGLGLHLRDGKLGGWLNLRAEWDKAVGGGASWCGGCLIAGTIHVPVMGQRGGFGLDVTHGEWTKVNVLAKVRLFRWGKR